DVHLQLRIALAEDARGARVVQMDVREQQHPWLGRTEPVDQGVDRGGRPRIDDHPVDLVGTDDSVAPEVEDVNRAGHRGPDHTISSVEEHRLPERDAPWVMRTYAGHSTA